ncbi:serum paraoxonase/arylesterase 2-like [Amphiura filiformis]|uniref:serum paraoxonase/arylesterase 2-like n=1 Tax=Amphiura filiformis TaxID=82378 RepID=UPI003B20F116
MKVHESFNMGLMWKVVCFSLVAYLIQHSIKVINTVGLFTPHRHNHEPGPCRLIPGIIYGSEDIHVLSNGIAVITAGLQSIDANASDDLRGFYMFDFNKPEKNITKLTMTGELNIKDLAPHGFSLWTDKDTGKVTIFVVNHGSTTFGNESVEVFEFEQKTTSVHHIKTIRDSQFKRLNDIVATSSKTFYATNDCKYFQSGHKWGIESLLQTRFGNVVYYGGTMVQVVASGYVLPNGINLSPDHRTLYLTVSGEAQLVLFDRHEDNSLAEVKRVQLYMLPDNVNVMSDGSLWIAGIYRLIPSEEHGLMSAMVLHAKVNEDKEPVEFFEVYINDGAVVSLSSVAAYYNEQLLIGTARNKLLYCEVKAF